MRALADFHYTHNRFTRAQELIERALRVDKLQEDLHAQAMKIYATLGDRSGLVSQYQEMKSLLTKELGMKPLSTTDALYKKLLDGFRN